MGSSQSCSLTQHTPVSVNNILPGFVAEIFSPTCYRIMREGQGGVILGYMSTTNTYCNANSAWVAYGPAPTLNGNTAPAYCYAEVPITTCSLKPLTNVVVNSDYSGQIITNKCFRVSSNTKGYVVYYGFNQDLTCNGTAWSYPSPALGAFNSANGALFNENFCN